MNKPVIDQEIEAACGILFGSVFSEKSMGDMRRALEAFAAGRAPVAQTEPAQAIPGVADEIEFIGYQFQWTNPANNPDHNGEMQWELLEPTMWNQTLEQKKEEILAYRYAGKPTYRVRAIYASVAAMSTSQIAEPIARSVGRVTAEQLYADDRLMALNAKHGHSSESPPAPCQIAQHSQPTRTRNHDNT